ncbi:MAG: TIGR03960 family B12-binding radical SAM protein [Desulfovibrio sp.]|nr:TIGR03960 family B12-binding radical SAM protein [Desulfovibrio sp.]
MREILPFIRRPSHFAGIEDGVCLKAKDAVSLHLALAFPDLYEVGMSYLGQKILYGIVNAHDSWWAERVMAPEKATGDYLKAHGLPLCTLESDTPLAKLDALGFSITHELCYTNVLYMLDLAGIPLRAKDRGQTLTQWPLIIAGGGALLSAEPLAPFMDLMLLGDGEEALPALLQLLEDARKSSLAKEDFLLKACELAGIYVPSFFEEVHGVMRPKGTIKHKPTRTIVADLDTTPYPARQVVPVGAVHNRLSIEIARGCTRGCRFCQAGMVYRPVRERSVANITQLLTDCLEKTGFEEISFLALSSGDYSALKTLSHATLDHCAAHQITLSLPSQRVGSIDDEIMARMADLRRTGMTLAPEAGSQRLRDVINKGISEEEIILHAQKLLEHGWRMVKLYFMIGLPTENDDDLAAIVDLCCRVRDAAGPGNPRLQVTAALSPFVPKPFTPFQWAEQINQQEISRRVSLVRNLIKGKKFLSLRWHEPAVSHLEGILSRAGRNMADVVEKAYGKGAIFCSWNEHFALAPWLEAMKECQISSEKAIAARDLEAPLPWDHLEAGISKDFLKREWQKALRGQTSADCRYNHCHGCGACDTQGSPSRLRTDLVRETRRFTNRLIFDHRDQNAHEAHFDEDGKLALRENVGRRPNLASSLTQNVVQYRIWHSKLGGCAFLSQLELQSVIERALRRGKVPVAFSRGFHPMPLLSFGRALPVGVESLAEWFSLTLASFLDAQAIAKATEPYLPQGMRLLRIESVDKKSRSLASTGEDFDLALEQSVFAESLARFKAFFAAKTVYAEMTGKKGTKSLDLRPMVRSMSERPSDTASSWQILSLCFDWTAGYLSPLRLVQSILGLQEDEPVHLLKRAQFFPDTSRNFASDLPWALEMRSGHKA